jgi:hypothetical protein
MSKATHRARILRVLETAPEGLTCKQVERMTGVRHSTASAALSALAEHQQVFRLAGFNKPYHWVTPTNLRGRPTLGKPQSKKDFYIELLENQVSGLLLRISLDYPTEPATVDVEQDRAEQEQHSGTHA